MPVTLPPGAAAWADVIVAPGAKVRADGTASPALARRIAAAAEAQRATGLPVIVSGAAAGAGPSEAAVMRDGLVARGVPAAAITLDEAARTTFENARNAGRIMRARGWRSALVVSEPYHAPRVVLTLRLLGVAATAAPANPAGARLGPRTALLRLREGLALPAGLARALAWRLRHGPLRPP